MEPRIFRFFQYIESIFSNFVTGNKIIAKRRVAAANVAAARPDRKETGNKVAGVACSFSLPTRLSAFSNLFFKKENFSVSSSSAFAGRIFFLFVGFVIGNLFGTFLPAIRLFFSWDGFIVLFLLFFIEFISYIRYQRKSRFFLILWNLPRGPESIPFWGINFQSPIHFAKEKEKFFLDLEDEINNPPRLNNEVTAAKKVKQNDNKIAFTGNFPFFRISLSPLFSNEGKTTFFEGSPPFNTKGYKSLNYFKIGFLLGFFIDAYKVGS
jgi:hypothetical protein